MDASSSPGSRECKSTPSMLEQPHQHPHHLQPASTPQLPEAPEPLYQIALVINHADTSCQHFITVMSEAPLLTGAPRKYTVVVASLSFYRRALCAAGCLQALYHQR